MATRKIWLSALPLCVMLSMSACGGDKAKQPTGQVVATVGGSEITARELNMELRGAQLPDAEAVKQAERAALDAIVNRKILAEAARERGISDTADFNLSRQRAEEVLLAEALQQQLSRKAPRPTRDEAETFIRANPELFATRKLFLVDQIQFERPTNPALLKMFEPLKTLNQVEELLLREGIEFQRFPSTIDSRSVPPTMVKQIANLPANEVFLIPVGGSILVNQVKEIRPVPLTGEGAIAYAQQLIYNERAGRVVVSQIEAIRKKAGKVSYKKGFGPPLAAPVGPAARPAAREAAPTGKTATR